LSNISTSGSWDATINAALTQMAALGVEPVVLGHVPNHRSGALASQRARG
jgi:hypothetical protein